MRTPRLLFAAVILGTVVSSGVGAAVNAAPRQPCGGQISDAGNYWQSIKPNWPSGGTHVVQALAVPYVPDRMYATNGTVVMQTDNDGCTWHAPTPAVTGGTLGLPVPPPLDGVLKTLISSDAHIVGIAAPSSATSSDLLYIAWNENSSVGTKPHVTIVGRTVKELDGLPDRGSIGSLDIAASDTSPTTAYVVIDGELGSAGGGQGFDAGASVGPNRAQYVVPELPPPTIARAETTSHGPALPPTNVNSRELCSILPNIVSDRKSVV